jgi:hypothetical protein
MDEAAPQAASGIIPVQIREALSALDAVWGDEYEFGWDPQPGFRARRHGATEWLLKAATPQELGKFLADDIRSAL